ncbi:chondroitinase-B domain-containing protein [Limibacter armeniacum]|uniref:chondroitinase-B domain-containing protein n=1 Tax=Limibacter armeniacum TaxID=466084 RepID=UPI002FE61E18
MKQPILWLLTMVGILISYVSQAATFTVSNASQLNSAIGSAQPGDTIVMTDGIWTNLNIVFDANGTSSSSITLKAATLGQVFIEGTSSLRIGGDYLTVEGLVFRNGQTASGAIIEFKSGSTTANHSRLTQCAIIDFNSGSADQKWVSLYGSQNRVDHCQFKGKTDGGTLLVVWLDGTVPNHQIDHNQFTDRAILGANGGEILRIGDSSTSMQNANTLVEYNYFANCDGEIEIISNKSGNNVYRHNTFYNNDGQLTLRHGNGCTVDGNYFFGNGKSGSSGVRIIGENHTVINNYFQDLNSTSNLRGAITVMGGIVDSPLNRYFAAKNCLVAHNTIVNCKAPFVIGSDKATSGEVYEAPSDNDFYNNVIYDNGSVTQASQVVDLEKPSSTFSGHVYAGNVYYGISTLANGTFSTSGWSNTNPNLSSASTTDGYTWFKITSSSTALINTAVGNLVTKDMEGQNRTTPDTGADEFATGSVDPEATPASATSAGPCWLTGDSCNETPIDNLSVSPSTLSFGSAAGSNTLSVFSNTSWTVTDNQAWISISSGSGSGNGNITISVTENTSTSSRSGTVTVTAGTLSETISVSQSGEAPEDGSDEIWLESECGTVGSAWEILSDGNASNGEYAKVKAGFKSTSSTPTGTDDQIAMSFNVTTADDYYIVARTTASSGSDDSFWVKVDGGNWISWSNVPQTAWTWSKVNIGGTDLVVNLSAGSHTLYFAYRESGAILDKIVLNTDGTLPSGTGSAASNCGGSGSSESQLPISSVSASSDDGNLPANTLDGDLATRWSAQGEGEWVKYDLGSIELVSKVKIAFHKGNERITSFDIAVSSDNSNWTNVITNQDASGNTLQLEEFDIVDSNARYIRITGHGNSSNDWNSLTEVEIWGGNAGSRLAANTTESLSTSFGLYPNPASDILTLQMENDARGTISVMLYDLTGKQLFQKLFEKETDQLIQDIPLPKVQPGLYLFRIEGSGIKQQVTSILIR